MSIHICSFSGGVANLSAKQRANRLIVLRALLADPMVSTWDMSEHGLWKTIDRLVHDGWITRVNVGYPWHKCEITSAGRAELEE